MLSPGVTLGNTYLSNSEQSNLCNSHVLLKHKFTLGVEARLWSLLHFWARGHKAHGGKILRKTSSF